MKYLHINFTKIHVAAIIPTYQTIGSAGADLYSVEDIQIQAGETRTVSIGLSMEIPEGYEGQIRSRSGLSVKGIIVANAPGTIDSDFRGEIKVILHNLGTIAFHVTIGLRIAQIVFNSYDTAQFIETNVLTNTARGEGGFGSTGF